MPSPTPRALLLLALSAPLAVLPIVGPNGLWYVWLIALVAALVLLGVDAILCTPRRSLTVDMTLPAKLHVGATTDATARITQLRGRYTVFAEVQFEWSPELDPPPRREVRIGVTTPTTVSFDLRPLRRGTATIHETWLRWRGPLGLMQQQTDVAHRVEIPIYPDIHASREALQMVLKRDLMAGISKTKMIGQGSEFDTMREYVPGLDSRSISWRASARHRKLVCHEYRTERDRQVILALDTGRLMSEQLGPLRKLDHAIHAGLSLAFASLRSGDRTGLFAFDERVRQFLEPRAGLSAMSHLQHAAATLDYQAKETNFTLGLSELALRLRRRSLVVLTTDFVDTTTAELMIQNVGRLVRRHVVVFVTFKDGYTRKVFDQAPTTLSALYRSVIADDFARERELVMRRIRRLGAFTIHAEPAHVTSALLNRYFAIQGRELVLDVSVEVA